MKRRATVIVLVAVVVALAAVLLFILTRPLRRRLALRIPREKAPQSSESSRDSINDTGSLDRAGPNQARLWARPAPAAGHDFYLSAINFEETKHYVRKVMDSDQRYGEIYERAGA